MQQYINIYNTSIAYSLDTAAFRLQPLVKYVDWFYLEWVPVLKDGNSHVIICLYVLLFSVTEFTIV